MERKLRKMPEKRMIGGVAAGIAYWLGIPTWIVRIVWAFSVLWLGAGAVLYIFFWIFMPAWEDTPPDYDRVAGG